MTTSAHRRGFAPPVAGPVRFALNFGCLLVVILVLTGLIVGGMALASFWTGGEFGFSAPTVAWDSSGISTWFRNTAEVSWDLSGVRNWPINIITWFSPRAGIALRNDLPINVNGGIVGLQNGDGAFEVGPYISTGCMTCPAGLTSLSAEVIDDPTTRGLVKLIFGCPGNDHYGVVGMPETSFRVVNGAIASARINTGCRP